MLRFFSFIHVFCFEIILGSQGVAEIVQRGPLFGTRHPVSASSIMHCVTLAQYRSQETDFDTVHRPCSYLASLGSEGLVILCSVFLCVGSYSYHHSKDAELFCRHKDLPCTSILLVFEVLMCHDEKATL